MKRTVKRIPDEFREAIKWALIIGTAALAGWLAGRAFDAAVASLHSVEGEGAGLETDEPAEGVARVPAVVRYLAGTEEDTAEAEYLLEEYTEWVGQAPEWYRPWEPMAAEWEAPERRDSGCPDWNLCTSLIGWDGHMMEVWEFELFVKIVYLEFWGTSRECCEAGIDSILLLWDSGEYGRTMGELLSSEYAPGYYVYSPYAYVWEWEYDPDGLAEIRAMCEKRFQNGPTWCAPYFRLWYYHPWGIDAYEIDGVYFSVPRG